MRILGVSELWSKLLKDNWTTFRFPRRDRDWEVGEVVQVVFKPRSKDRGILGQARINQKDPRWVMFPDESFMICEKIRENPKLDHVYFVSECEAKLDGFENRRQMFDFMIKRYDIRVYDEPMNRLVLSWMQIWLYQQKGELVRAAWAKMHNEDEEIPRTILMSGYLAPLVWERELLKECGIEPPVLTLGNSFLGGRYGS